MNPATTEGRGRRRWGGAIVTAAIMLALAGYAAVATGAATTVAAARTGALLAGREQDRTALRTLDASRIGTALASRPLDQRLVNVAMAWAVDQGGAARIAPWIAVVSGLGWRDTAALQNRLYIAVSQRDLIATVDLVDALMRRRQLMDQMVQVLGIAETDPAARAMLAERLVRRPGWRGVYLSATGHLRTREQMAMRYRLLRDLDRRGSPATRAEVAQNIRAFDQGGQYDLAYRLWRSISPRATQPLGDTGFLAASEGFRLGEDDPVAFEWQIPGGEGFRVDAAADNGRGVMTIDWNGRGVPLFAQQRISGGPGNYRLRIEAEPGSVADLGALDFRLVCKDAVVDLQRVARQPQVLVTERPVPCAFALLQVAGGIQSAATPHQIALRRVVLEPLAGAGAPD